MKKVYIKYCAAAVLTVFGFSSCLDDEGVFKENGSSGIIELVLPARTTSTPYAVKTTTVEVEDVMELPVEVNYTGVNPAPQDIEVELVIVDEAIAIYDPSGTTLALPASNYELPASNVITIPKGQKKAVYTVKLKPKTFDLTKLYALAIKIARASSGIVSGNYSTGIYSLPVKSPWEGTYTYLVDWILPSSLSSYQQYFPTEYEGESVTTQGPGIVRHQYVGDLFSGWTNYIFYPDETVGVEFSVTTFTGVEVLESHADINTLTFSHKTKFSHASYGDFVLIEQYTKTGD
jgi:hypothetical protein